MRGLEQARQLGLRTYDHAFGSRSEGQLSGVLPALVDVARLAIRLSPRDGTIVPPAGGVRTYEQALANVKNGTGILDSRHRVQSDGWGHAIDLAPYPIDWQDMQAFQDMARSVRLASAILRVPVRQGCDWNMNGTWGESREWDWAHFEDPLPKYRARAEELMDDFAKGHGLRVAPNSARRSLAVCPTCGGSGKAPT